jgi:hypothetical protein
MRIPTSGGFSKGMLRSSSLHGGCMPQLVALNACARAIHTNTMLQVYTDFGKRGG